MSRLATPGGRASASTNAATGQLIRPSRHIFMTNVIEDDGTKRQVMSSKPLCGASIRINTHNNRLLLLTWMGLCAIGRFDDAANHYLNFGVIYSLTHYRDTRPDVWSNIIGFVPGFEPSVADYALVVAKPQLFKVIMNSDFVVDAVMRGQEDIVMNALHDDPTYILRAGAAKNSVCVEYTVKPLQAAIMANDPQMAHKIAKYFGQIRNGNVVMEQQITQIYRVSLRRYCDKQEAEVRRLTALQAEGTVIDVVALLTAQKRCEAYLQALTSDNILEIFNAHNAAQEHNAFDFQLYADVIVNANTLEETAALDDLIALIKAITPEETAAIVARCGVAARQTTEARSKSFDDLTLIEKLNHMREKLIEHMRAEIIFNPYHTLGALTVNERVRNMLRHTRDQDYKKRDVICVNLPGYALRKASEPTKQDIRQGIWYLTKKNEQRARPPCFNGLEDGNSVVRNVVEDVSLIDPSCIDGVGYKFLFSCAGVALGFGRLFVGPSDLQGLYGATKASFQNLFAQLPSARDARRCVAQ
jgi:hypothetical protein